MGRIWFLYLEKIIPNELDLLFLDFQPTFWALLRPASSNISEKWPTGVKNLDHPELDLASYCCKSYSLPNRTLS